MADNNKSKAKKYRVINPFVEKILVNYYAKQHPDTDVDAMFIGFCRELAKYVDNKPDPTSRQNRYKAEIYGKEVVFKTTGCLSQQFQCINNKKGEMEQNVINRNMIFVYALSKWLKDNSIDLPELEDVHEDNAVFEILWGEIYNKQENGKNDYIEKLLSSGKEAASFIFCCYSDSYYKNIKLDPKITGKDPQRLLLPDVKANIRQDIIWNSIWGRETLNWDVLGSWAVTVIKETLKQPLFHLILNKWAHYKSKKPDENDDSVLRHCEEYHKAYLTLLRSSLDLSGSQPNVLPATAAFDDYLMKKVKEISTKAEYTVKDILNTYGKIADTITIKRTWFFKESEAREICDDKALEKDILSLKKGHENIINKTPNKKYAYKFAIKPYRLFFKALYDAHNFNLRERASFPMLFENLHNLCEMSFINSDLVNLDASFVEDGIVYASILIKYLDENKRNGLIDFLLEKSKNFTVKHREDQILAIYLLTIILSENSDLLTFKQRKDIYDNTYAKIAYKMQIMQFENLKETSAFFENEIIRSFNKNFDDQSLMSNFQPIYFFWYDIVFADNTAANKIRSTKLKTFCTEVFNLRRNIWSRERQASDIDLILKSIKDGINIVKKYDVNNNPPETRMLAYAINALLYTIANILNYDNVYRDKLKKQLEIIIRESSDFYMLVFFSDSIIRKSNKIYMKYYDRGIAGDRDMYLLCGAFRVFCALGHVPDEIKYPLSSEMYNQYSAALKKEYGRYFFLLSYILSFTDFFNRKNVYFKDYVLNESADFLSYDNLDMDNIIKHPLDVEKWRKD